MLKRNDNEVRMNISDTKKEQTINVHCKNIFLLRSIIIINIDPKINDIELGQYIISKLFGYNEIHFLYKLSTSSICLFFIRKSP